MEYISYNTGTRALPDIYALALGRSGIVRIYQAKHSCLCYNYYLDYVLLLLRIVRTYIILSMVQHSIVHFTTNLGPLHLLVVLLAACRYLARMVLDIFLASLPPQQTCYA